ncbi:MAG: DNA methyltransferase [Anaerolineaceae bacterium]|nr:DNA methyltransferase [Anaerolineaceae bacterium]
MTENTLFYGDNLDILREHIDDESVDLVYLDPPFNSNRSYNVLFRDESGRVSDAQITAFEDNWHWGPTAQTTWESLVLDQSAGERVASAMASMRDLLGTNQMMAYLVMMAARLAELQRVLKPTGSLYLHCDPTASHYLKILLDTIFGPWNFRNEIVWKRTHAHNDPERYGRINDTIFFYTKSDDYCWNRLFTPYTEEYLEKNFKEEDERGKFQSVILTGPKVSAGESGSTWRGYSPTDSGRSWSVPRRVVELLGGPEALDWPISQRLDLLDEHGYIIWPKTKKGKIPRFKEYLHEMPGVPLQSNWTDINPVPARSPERLGYPTQKPVALLGRIVGSSSNPGDVVLDPFCGCGTAIDAAQGLDRRWIGIDITHLSVALMKYRLRDRHNLHAGVDYHVEGEPQDLAGAHHLAKEVRDGRNKFQFWATSLVEARPLGGSKKKRKKGADQGIDGVIRFYDGSKERIHRVLVQVKSGKVGVKDIRDFRGTLEREMRKRNEKAVLGVFITLEKPTRPMEQEALDAGIHRTESWGEFRRIQIVTIEQLLAGDQIDLPRGRKTFLQAPRAPEQREKPGRLL